jgi:hypothetical protein
MGSLRCWDRGIDVSGDRGSRSLSTKSSHFDTLVHTYCIFWVNGVTYMNYHYSGLPPLAS